MFIFQEQAFLYDFSDIGTCQLHAVGKTCLDLREIITLLLVHLTNHGVHVFLGRHYDPGTPPAFGRETLSHSLQVSHKFRL